MMCPMGLIGNWFVTGRLRRVCNIAEPLTSMVRAEGIIAGSGRAG